MRRLAVAALLASSCICGDLDRAYDELSRRADGGVIETDAGPPDAGSTDAGTPGDDAGPPDAGNTDAGPLPDGGVCQPQNGPCAADPNSCCPGLCCASNGTTTLCLPDPPTAFPGFLCVI